MFVNAGAQDYYLPPQSPLIDRGVVIAGINDDYLGSAPDIGALEFGMEAQKISTGVTGVVIEWHVGAFGRYQLQTGADPSQAAWKPVGAPVQAVTTVIQLSDPSPTDTQRFYRLQHLAP